MIRGRICETVFEGDVCCYRTKEKITLCKSNWKKPIPAARPRWLLQRLLNQSNSSQPEDVSSYFNKFYLNRSAPHVSPAPMATVLTFEDWSLLFVLIKEINHYWNVMLTMQRSLRCRGDIIKFIIIIYYSDFQPVFRGKLVFRERSSGVPQEIW